jgi:hypothetical protein
MIRYLDYPYNNNNMSNMSSSKTVIINEVKNDTNDDVGMGDWTRERMTNGFCMSQMVIDVYGIKRNETKNIIDDE